MQSTKDIKEDGDDSEEAVFIENYCSSDDSDQKHQSSCKQTARLNRESSPPLVLAFSFTSGRTLEDSSPIRASANDSEDEEEDCEEPVEEWMILGREEQVEDSDIQLNLGYWSSCEDESRDEDPNVKSFKDTWDVSEKDKCSGDRSLSSRYFLPSTFLICNFCNGTGHLAKSCYYYKKCPTCVLCGIQGHNQRNCPSRPCRRCGLPSHGLRPCEKPPVWNQLCQRCGMMGHLSDTCPDTWRQFHLTIRLEVPLRPWTVQTLKQRRRYAHCYNCSKRGHYGYECVERRMVSGTFPTFPYVCHYDTMEDILQYHTKNQKGAKDIVDPGCTCSSEQQNLFEATGDIGEQNRPIQGRNRTALEAYSQATRRKTWPERRKERQEVKRLRREAQARREGGLLRRSQGISDDEACHADPFKSPCYVRLQFSPPLLNKKRDEVGGRRSRKVREVERWKKRGGMKRGDLHPHGDLDIRSENLLSPKQRVRHRRR